MVTTSTAKAPAITPQISELTWLLRTLSSTGVPTAAPEVVTGLTSTTRTPVASARALSRTVVRWPACSTSGSGAVISRSGAERARTPTRTGWSSSLTSVTVNRPVLPDMVTRSLPTTTRMPARRARTSAGSARLSASAVLSRRAWYETASRVSRLIRSAVAAGSTSVPTYTSTAPAIARAARSWAALIWRWRASAG